MAGRPQAEWALPRILPQVRWHGRKEYMESLEPVAPVAAAAEAAARRPPEAEGAEARAAELVQAAEGQVTELRRWLEATSELLRAAESEKASYTSAPHTASAPSCGAAAPARGQRCERATNRRWVAHSDGGY